MLKKVKIHNTHAYTKHIIPNLFIFCLLLIKYDLKRHSLLSVLLHRKSHRFESQYWGWT